MQGNTIQFALANSSSDPVAASVCLQQLYLRQHMTPTAALTYGMTYTATVSGAQNTSGVAMLSPVSWSFTINLGPPVVTTESPAFIWRGSRCRDQPP